jgi:methylmalonyl-CoA mutase C-terminal domain/subunit
MEKGGVIMARKIKVLMSKAGLDGHDRGVKVVARAFRDAGMEVVYTGLHVTPQEIVETALQEDVDVIGVSILSGAHRSLVPRIINLAREKGLENIVFIVGGIIPQDDVPILKNCGVHEVFGPMTKLDEIVAKTQKWVNELRSI